MAIEGFLWSVVPAVSSSGHRLSDIPALKQINEADAGIVAALIGMDQSVRMDII